MGRPFQKPDAEAYIELLRKELEIHPSASTGELATATGVSLPTVRKYRKLVQGYGVPRRERIRFVRRAPAFGSVQGPPLVRRPPRRYVHVSVQGLAGGAVRSLPQLPHLNQGWTDIGAAAETTFIPDPATLAEVRFLRSQIGEVRELLRTLIPPTPGEPSASEQRWKSWLDSEEKVYRLYRSTGGVPPDIQWTLRWWRWFNVQSDLGDSFGRRRIADISPLRRLDRTRSESR